MPASAGPAKADPPSSGPGSQPQPRSSQTRPGQQVSQPRPQPGRPTKVGTALLKKRQSVSYGNARAAGFEFTAVLAPPVPVPPVPQVERGQQQQQQPTGHDQRDADGVPLIGPGGLELSTLNRDDFDPEACKFGSVGAARLFATHDHHFWFQSSIASWLAQTLRRT
jgi:hypothetical protein